MLFFRIAVFLCAISTVAPRASAATRRPFWRKKTVATCAIAFQPTSVDLGYLDVTGLERIAEAGSLIRRAPHGEWRTTPVSREREAQFSRMTYELFDLSRQSPELRRALRSAFYVFLEWGGDTDDVRIDFALGHARLDLPVGVPGAAFALELERLFAKGGEPVDAEGEARELTDQWLARHAMFFAEALPRDAAE